MPAPGPVNSAPLVRGLIGGSQTPSKPQEAAQEEAQHQDKAQREDNPREGQEQALNKKDGVGNLGVSKVISISLQVKLPTGPDTRCSP